MFRIKGRCFRRASASRRSRLSSSRLNQFEYSCSNWRRFRCVCAQLLPLCVRGYKALLSTKLLFSFQALGVYVLCLGSFVPDGIWLVLQIAGFKCAGAFNLLIEQVYTFCSSPFWYSISRMTDLICSLTSLAASASLRHNSIFARISTAFSEVEFLFLPKNVPL